MPRWVCNFDCRYHAYYGDAAASCRRSPLRLMRRRGAQVAACSSSTYELRAPLTLTAAVGMMR